MLWAARQFLVRAIISLAKAFNLQTVAEGVEDPSILPELKKLGCDSAQGFHFARPMPAGDLNAMLQQTFRRRTTPYEAHATAR